MSFIEHYTTAESKQLLEYFIKQVDEDIENRLSSAVKDSDEYKKILNQKILLDFLFKSSTVATLEHALFKDSLHKSVDLLTKIMSFLNNSEYSSSALMMKFTIDVMSIINSITEVQRAMTKQKKEIIEIVKNILDQSDKKMVEEKTNLIDITQILNQMKGNTK